MTCNCTGACRLPPYICGTGFDYYNQEKMMADNNEIASLRSEIDKLKFRIEKLEQAPLPPHRQLLTEGSPCCGVPAFCRRTDKACYYPKTGNYKSDGEREKG